jgi:hypothetical protein
VTGTALALGLLASWWATGLRPFTWPALIATVAAGLGAVVAGHRGGVGAGRSGTRPLRPGAAVWAALFVALAGWELAAFLQHPRVDHPTLSSLADGVLRYHPARAAAFLAWLSLGASLGHR